jgi:hypothetical protein
LSVASKALTGNWPLAPGNLMMISADHAISRFRRDLTLGWLLKVLLGAAAVGCLAAPAALGAATDTGVALAAVGVLWIFLSYKSLRGSRLSADSPMLIAAGQFDQAERKIDEALRSFSLFGRLKLTSLHHLALLRHAQRRWQETTELSRAILRQRLSLRGGVSRPTRLILADSLLELGDLDGAAEQIEAVRRQRLNLMEMTTFLLIQLDYQHRVRAWEAMMNDAGRKVELAETMPAAAAARTQALMALAAQKLEQTQWRDWLRGRAELLADAGEIVKWRPKLRELWAEHRQEATEAPTDQRREE